MVDDTLVDLSEKQLAVNHFSITRRPTLSSLVDEVHDNGQCGPKVRRVTANPLLTIFILYPICYITS